MENGKNDAGNQKDVKRKKPNYISRIFMCWICPVLFRGNQRNLEEDDLIEPYSRKYKSNNLGDRLEAYWIDELESAAQKNKKPSLWMAMVRSFWVAYMPGAILVLLNMIARAIQPLVFTQLLTYWSADTDMDWSEACYWALGMLGLNFVAMICQHHNQMFVGRFGLKVKVACSSLMFRKLLRMSQGSIQQVPAGKVVNLMSNDMSRFDYAFLFMHYLWLIPVQLSVVLYFMYNAAGWAPFVGLFSVIFLVLPLQAGLTKLTAVIRRITAVKSDKRIKLMTEIVNGIQVIKMYAWEKPFQVAVKAARADEMSSLKKAMFVNGTFGSFMMFTERSSIFLTILTLTLTGNLVTATLIYPIQQYFNIIQSNLAMMLPMAIANISEMFVTIDRIQAVLVLEERDDLSLMPKTMNDEKVNNIFSAKEDKNATFVVSKSYTKNDEPLVPTKRRGTLVNEFAVELNDVSASWTKNGEKTLKNVSMRVRKGKLCAIIGSVGAGKTSLLQLLLKELPASKGSVHINGTLSYSCQESWLFSGTVRENICFGLPYDSKKYKEVCQACCLMPDFRQFPYGDLSLVGERGVSLSGGQRARINLARAVYREADVYLLDDPLSAVDANVGRQLFEGCLKGYLRGRTCILVTHQIHFLKGADYIVVLNEGSIEDMGTYGDLIKSENDLSLLRLNAPETPDAADTDEKELIVKRPSLERSISTLSAKSDDIAKAEKEQLQAAEERATGNLKWEVFVRYLKSVDSWFFIMLALSTMLITQAAATITDYWISYWTNNVDNYIQGLENEADAESGLDVQVGPLTIGQYVYIHAGLIVTVVSFAFIRLGAFVLVTMSASTNVHDLMFRNLIRVIMRFFDTNPSGRILNRFSKDMGGMDELLPRSLLQVVQMYLAMLSVLVLNAMSLPWTLIPTFVLMTLFILLLKWYLNAGQAVKRLEGTTKSPVFGMITSTLSGMTTIRSSGSQDRLSKQFDDCQNMNTSAFYTYLGGSTAFGFYLDMLCLTYLTAILSIFILIDFDGLIPVGSVGLAVTQSMALTMLLQLAARFTSDFLAQMTAVERLLEYTKLPHEKNIDEGPTQPSEEWPSNGNVTFENVYLHYVPEDPPVLKNINVNIITGSKVGVVGRTGAGKSSLISALFRLSNIEGSIKIDGVDTKGVALQLLRSKISIIPQEPVLFSASIRYNLDPFNLYSDDQIWRALEQVELKDAVPALDFHVSEGGSNFSVGQRQLVCLARALLRSNKILVMDEATANVDPQTDALIQTTIRREFVSCTVITIAHRLNTIMDSDKVMVMDAGVLAEFDHPYTLLLDPNSKFSFMVKETGESSSKSLFEVAKTKYMQDNPKR